MDPAVRREVLRLVPYGLYAVTCAAGERHTGFTATWLTQCSFEPPLLALGVRPDSLAAELIAESGAFVVNFVGRDRTDLLQAFFRPVARSGDKLAGWELLPGPTGPPILAVAVAWLACRVVDRAAPGDHIVFFAEVVEAGRPSAAEPIRLADTPWHYGG